MHKKWNENIMKIRCKYRLSNTSKLESLLVLKQQACLDKIWIKRFIFSNTQEDEVTYTHMWFFVLIGYGLDSSILNNIKGIKRTQDYKTHIDKSFLFWIPL